MDIDLTQEKSYCEVAVNYPKLNSTLTYIAPKELSLSIGDLVEVPLGRRKELGCVVSLDVKNVDKKIKYKSIDNLEKEHFKLSLKEIELYKWVSKYYVYSFGKLIFDCLPKYLKRIKEPAFVEYEEKIANLGISKEQEDIILKIKEKFGEFNQSLVHGVTGSGKSLIFLELIKIIINSGKSVQFLVPEINLTPQFLKFFSSFLKCKVFVYHSEITGSQKFNLWRTLKNIEEPVLIVGVRSSVFLPVNNLGLIIVDEEHDSSFKQEDRCRFNARDVAIKKAQIHNINIILGSATPTLENYERFKKNNYYDLKKRYRDSKLPKVEIINNPPDSFEHWPLSQKSLDRIKETYQRGAKSIVFVNKLGFSRYIQCGACFKTFECPNCSIRLTYFKKRHSLECYCCEYKEKVASECPDCGCLDLFHQGFGTEKVFEALNKNFPQMSIERFDRDAIKNFKEVEKTLKRFEDNEIDLLVGTQMIAKGHNLKNVESIIVLGIDSTLHSSDFRAPEKIYQLLTQVIGRAGRFGEDSKVYIQSDLRPSFFKHIENHSFDDFYKEELILRETLSLPPFSKMAQLSFEAISDFEARNKAQKIKTILKKIVQINKLEIKVHGPLSSSIIKKKNRFYWYLLLYSKKSSQLNDALSFLQSSNFKELNNSMLSIDPINLI